MTNTRQAARYRPSSRIASVGERVANGRKGGVSEPTSGIAGAGVRDGREVGRNCETKNDKWAVTRWTGRAESFAAAAHNYTTKIK